MTTPAWAGPLALPPQGRLESRGRNTFQIALAAALGFVSLLAAGMGLVNLITGSDVLLPALFFVGGLAGIVFGVWGLRNSIHHLVADGTGIRRLGMFGWDVPWAQVAALEIRPHGQSLQARVRDARRDRTRGVYLPHHRAGQLLALAREHGVAATAVDED